jgi:hypothetical protein
LELKEILSVFAGILSVVGSLWYILAILFYGVRPKRVTWFIWGTLDLIILAGMWQGGHVTNWQIIVGTVNAWIIFLLALRYGVSKWEPIDTICLVGAGISTGLLWQYPTYALAMSLLATYCGVVPTCTSAWQNPSRENVTAWMIGVAASAFVLCTVPWTFVAAAQPLTFLVVDGAVPLIILIRRW